MRTAGRRATCAFVEDIARANLLAAESDKLDGLPVNVGSGRATSVRDLAGIIARQLGVDIAPLARRVPPRRNSIADFGHFAHPTIGYEPSVAIEEGNCALRCVDTNAGARFADYFAAAEAGLRAKGIVQSVNG